MTQLPPITFATRFRGFLPVVVDVETGGFNHQTDALLEIAAVFLEIAQRRHARPRPDRPLPRGAVPRRQPGARIDGRDGHRSASPAAPRHSRGGRAAKDFPARYAMPSVPADCTRAVLVGHNAFFDLNFLNAAVARTQVKRNPFHPFSSFDTATLGASPSSNGADAGHPRRGPRVGHGIGAFRFLRCGTHGRPLLHGVQSVPRCVRRQPAPLGVDGAAGSRALRGDFAGTRGARRRREMSLPTEERHPELPLLRHDNDERPV